MSKLKAHLKHYGRLHLIAIIFIAGGIWQATYDYEWAMQHKVDWDILKKTLMFHSFFISLYFAVWAGRATWIWVKTDEYRKNNSTAVAAFLSMWFSLAAFGLASAISIAVIRSLNLKSPT